MLSEKVSEQIDDRKRPLDVTIPSSSHDALHQVDGTNPFTKNINILSNVFKQCFS